MKQQSKRAIIMTDLKLYWQSIFRSRLPVNERHNC